MSYLPSMRIELEAEPMEHFIENVKHNMGFKMLVSVIVAQLSRGLSPTLIKRARRV